MLAGLADDDARLFSRRHSRSGRCPCPGSNRGRNPGQSVWRSWNCREGMTAGRTGGWIRRSPFKRSSWPARGALPRRLEALPEATQRLMLVAAADPTGDVGSALARRETLGIGRDAAVAVEAEQLVDFGSPVRSDTRSFARRSIREHRRRIGRAAHLALAESTDPELHPDRRAWHLASAAAGPDEAVASELERSADRAQSRGGLAAAAAFLRRSVALTEDPRLRVDRALTAAQAHVRIGALDEASRLLGAGGD